MAEPRLELIPLLATLIPVVVGGVIALTGALGGGLLTHWLKTKSERSARKAEKFEELLGAIFEYKHWLAQISSHRVFGGDKPEWDSPAAKIRAISALYFPEFKEKLIAMEVAADQYEMTMYPAGVERLRDGAPSQEALDANKDAYKPFLAAFLALVKDLEVHAKQIAR